MADVYSAPCPVPRILCIAPYGGERRAPASFSVHDTRQLVTGRGRRAFCIAAANCAAISAVPSSVVGQHEMWIFVACYATPRRWQQMRAQYLPEARKLRVDARHRNF